MTPVTERYIQEVLNAYGWNSDTVTFQPYGEGHINQTYLITTCGEQPAHYILQRINTEVFKNVDGLMQNICGVTAHLEEKIAAAGGDTERETMHVVYTADQRPYYQDSAENAWRIYRFVEDTICLQKCRDTEDFYTSARAFGQFQNYLADYDAASLYESIPDFHNTADRYLKFEAALAQDVMGRAQSVAEEITFVKQRREDCSYMVNLLAEGKLPLRVTHNDTKLNNILLDNETGKALCIIDLDTVMPGLAANDYGDSIRFGANDCAEDEPDLTKVNFSLELFEAYTKGFLETSGNALTSLEIETLPWGARLMTLECGIRFLTDYLEGDHYFATHRPNQNLDRCRTQFKLVRDMEEHWEEMQKIVKKYTP